MKYLILFYADWCPHCKIFIPVWKKLEESYTDNNNIELLENAFAQIMMSILSFHRFTSLIHKDTHAGNFLFHKIKKGGYIHYVFNKKNIYIKNVGYLWIIWDYGLAKDMNQLHYFIIDYIKICTDRIQETLKRKEIEESTLRLFNEPIAKYHTLNYKIGKAKSSSAIY